MPSRTATFDSNGPEGRIRGNAAQVYEKYLALARDAASSGDRVLAESFQQYAEHYYRVMNDSTDPQPLRPQMAEPREVGDGEEPQRGEWNSEPRGDASFTRSERPRYEGGRNETGRQESGRQESGRNETGRHEGGRGGISEPSQRNGQDAPFSRDRRAEGLSFESGDPRDQPNLRPVERGGEPQPRESRPPREERGRFDRRREDGRARGGNGGSEESEDAGLRKMLGDRPPRLRETGREEETPDESSEEPRQSGPQTAEDAGENQPRRRRRRRTEEAGKAEDSAEASEAADGGESEDRSGSEEI